MKSILIYGGFILTTLIYSSIFIVLKPVVSEVDAFTVSILRVVLPAACVPILFIFFKPEKIEKQDIKLFILGALGYLFLNQILSSYGLKYTSAARAGIISNLLPISIILLSFFFLKEKLTKQKLIGIVISLIGGFLLISSYFHGDGLKSGNIIGDILVILGVMSTSVTYITNAKLVAKYKTWTVISYYLLISGTLFTPFLFYVNDFHAMRTISISNWIKIGYIGIIGILIANALSVWVTKYINIIVLSLSNYLTAFLSVLWAVLIFNDPLTFTDLIGGILIIFGVYYINSISKKNLEETKHGKQETPVTT